MPLLLPSFLGGDPQKKVKTAVCVTQLFLKTTVQTERSALYPAHLTHLEHVSYRTLQLLTKAENKLISII